LKGGERMENLKELRLDRGMTQVDVAKAVGVSLSAYVLWERGVMNPTQENLEKLKDVLGIK